MTFDLKRIREGRATQGILFSFRASDLKLLLHNGHAESFRAEFRHGGLNLLVRFLLIFFARSSFYSFSKARRRPIMDSTRLFASSFFSMSLARSTDQFSC